MLRLLQSTKQFSRNINVAHLNKQISKTYSSSIMGNILLNNSEGWKRYDRAGAGKKEGASTESVDSNKNSTKNTKTNNSNSDTSNNFKSEQKTNGSGSSGGAGGGGKKPNGNGFDFQNMGAYWWLIPSTALLLVILISDMREGREISWQDFQTQLLEGGHVDRIIVTNKNIARFYLCTDFE